MDSQHDRGTQRRKRLWNRCDVHVCDCDEFRSTRGAVNRKHVHCPCLGCQGKAVARTVEYRHYQQQKVLMEHDNNDIERYLYL